MLLYSTIRSALMEKLVTPLQDKIEEWKKTAALLDKDHAKGMTDAGIQCYLSVFFKSEFSYLSLFFIAMFVLQNTNGLDRRLRRSPLIL